MSASISSLIKHPHIFRGRDQHSSVGSTVLRLPFGQPELDKASAGGVPAAGALSLRALPGHSEIQFLNDILQQKVCTQKKIVWLHNTLAMNPNWICQTTYQQQSWVLTTSHETDALWACEQCIRSQACCCVVMYTTQIAHKAARRLQVLAKQYDCLVIIIHSGKLTPGTLPVNIDMELSFQAEQWYVHLHRVTGAWPKHHIAVNHPLPASNTAIVNAFNVYRDHHPAAVHEVS